MGLFLGKTTGQISSSVLNKRVGRIESEKILQELDYVTRKKLIPTTRKLGTNVKSIRSILASVKKEHGNIIKKKFSEAIKNRYDNNRDLDKQKKRNLLRTKQKDTGFSEERHKFGGKNYGVLENILKRRESAMNKAGKSREETLGKTGAGGGVLGGRSEKGTAMGRLGLLKRQTGFAKSNPSTPSSTPPSTPPSTPLLKSSGGFSGFRRI